MKALSTIIVMGILAFFLNTPIYAQQVGLLIEAIEHAQAGITEGKKGDAMELVERAKESMVYTEAVKKEYDMARKQNKQFEASYEHIEEAIVHLKEAIESGGMSKPEVAAKHLENAVIHMRKSRP